MHSDPLWHPPTFLIFFFKQIIGVGSTFSEKFARLGFICGGYEFEILRFVLRIKELLFLENGKSSFRKKLEIQAFWTEGEGPF